MLVYRLNFEGSAAVPGSSTTARVLEARFNADTMQAMRPFRLALPATLGVGIAIVCALFAAPYPDTVALLAACSAAQIACLLALYLWPAYGNSITAVQLVCYWRGVGNARARTAWRPNVPGLRGGGGGARASASAVACDVNALWWVILGVPAEAPLIAIGAFCTRSARASVQLRVPTHCSADAGGGVLAAGITRVRVREFCAAATVHTLAAAVAVAWSRPPAQAAANVLVMCAGSIVGVVGSYTTERRERLALLLDYRLALAQDVAHQSGACTRKTKVLRVEMKSAVAGTTESTTTRSQASERCVRRSGCVKGVPPAL